MSRSVGKRSRNFGPFPVLLRIPHARISPSSLTAQSLYQDRRLPLLAKVHLLFFLIIVSINHYFTKNRSWLTAKMWHFSPILSSYCNAHSQQALINRLLVCLTVPSSPVNQHMDEPVMVNGQSSDTTDTDTGRPLSKESSPSKSNFSEDVRSPKERSSSLSDPEAQSWIQVEKRHRNSSGKNKVPLDAV